MTASVILRVLLGLVNAYCVIILIYVLMSWIPSGSRAVDEIKRVLGKVVDPFLAPFRKLIPPIGGMVDISPIIGLLVLQLITRLIIWLY